MHVIYKIYIWSLWVCQVFSLIMIQARLLKNAQFRFSSRKAKILTTGIHWVFRGLKFEPDAEIGQKGVFFKGLVFLLFIVNKSNSFFVLICFFVNLFLYIYFYKIRKLFFEKHSNRFI